MEVLDTKEYILYIQCKENAKTAKLINKVRNQDGFLGGGVCVS